MRAELRKAVRDMAVKLGKVDRMRKTGCSEEEAERWAVLHRGDYMERAFMALALLLGKEEGEMGDSPP